MRRSTVSQYLNQFSIKDFKTFEIKTINTFQDQDKLVLIQIESKFLHYKGVRKQRNYVQLSNQYLLGIQIHR